MWTFKSGSRKQNQIKSTNEGVFVSPALKLEGTHGSEGRQPEGPVSSFQLIAGKEMGI